MRPTWGTEMHFDIDVLHSFPLSVGCSLNGTVLSERTFVPAGLHTVVAEKSVIERLEESGYLEILTVDGKTNVWPACCKGDRGH